MAAETDNRATPPLGALKGRRIAIAGSASRTCSRDQLARAHALVRALVVAILKEGGSLVVLASDEPRLDAGSDGALIFDWTVVEAMDEAMREAKPPEGGVWVVTAQKAIQRKIPTGRRALLGRLVESGRAQLLMIDDAVYTGGNIRDAMVGCTDALVALGGGKGVADHYRKLATKRIPVVPLDLAIGSLSEDGEGAPALYREALVTPDHFFYAVPDRLRNVLVASSLQEETQDIPTVAAGLVSVVAEELSHHAMTSDRQVRVATQATTADIVILTALPAELRAVQQALGMTANPQTALFGANYWLASLESSRAGRRYSAAVACLGTAGNTDAAAVTMELIATLGPSLVVMVGIAGGLRGAVRLGEVVLASRIVTYEPAALVAVEGSPTQRPRPEIPRSSATLEQDVAAYLAADPQSRCAAMLSAEGIVLSDVRDDERSFVVGDFTVGAATLASGEKLFRDGTAAEALRQLHGKIVGLEMEGFGVATAARHAQVDFLVVRGISDFADATKDDRFHQYAAGAAAVAAIDFIRRGLFLRPHDEVRGDDR